MSGAFFRPFNRTPRHKEILFMTVSPYSDQVPLADMFLRPAARRPGRRPTSSAPPRVTFKPHGDHSCLHVI